MIGLNKRINQSDIKFTVGVNNDVPILEVINSLKLKNDKVEYLFPKFETVAGAQNIFRFDNLEAGRYKLFFGDVEMRNGGCEGILLDDVPDLEPIKTMTDYLAEARYKTNEYKKL